MIHRSIAFCYPDDLEVEGTTEQHLRYAIWLKLPFRFRTGRLYECALLRTQKSKIWILNRFDLPEGTGWEQRMALEREKGVFGRADHLWSEALLIAEKPRLEANTLANVKDGSGRIPSTHNLFSLLESFNEFVCAYATAINEIFGGQPLKMLTDIEMMQHLYAEVTLLCPPEYALVEANVMEVFNWKPDREYKMVSSLTGQLDDFPRDALSKIPSSLEKIRDHVFYEIAFKAKMEMVSRDFTTALLLACIALEGAHSAFLKRALESKQLDTETIDDYQRELGISNLLKITPKLFMTYDARPNDESIRKCLGAFSLRNKIVHSLMTKGGEYHLRLITPAQISEAYSAVLKVYTSFVAALEA